MTRGAMMMGMTLTEFLTARFGEDEHRARMAGNIKLWHDEMRRVWIEHPSGARTELTQAVGNIMEAGWVDHLATHLPSRVLAEVEAKRRIVALADMRFGDPNDYGQMDSVVRLLALPYADHPDYRQEWKP